MDTDLRASLVAAGAAAALSALVGLVAGVGFLVLLLRALVGGGVFGALAYGGITLARRLLPGMERGAEGGRESPPAPERTVDIVLPGEGEAGEPSASRKVPSAEIFARAGPRDEADEVGSLLEPETSVPSASIEIAAQAATPSVVADGGDDLDLLPDLEGFSDSFAAPEYRASAAAPSASRLADSGPRAPAAEGMDPSKMAQAVRTILKRDQKG